MSINDLKTGLVSIADAIRSKTGGTASLKIEDMPAAIQSIETGSGGSSSEIQWPPDGWDTDTNDYILVDTTLWDDDTDFTFYAGDVAKVDWGDGSEEESTNYDRTHYNHTYAPGRYIVKIEWAFSGNGLYGFNTYTQTGANGTNPTLGAFGQYSTATTSLSGIERANHYVRKFICKHTANVNTNTFCYNLMIDEIRFVNITNPGYEAPAFKYCVNLQKVYFDSSVLKINIGQFDYCGNLREVSLPGSISEIPMHSFRWTALRSFSIDSSAYTVGNYVFAYTKLTELDLSKATSLGTNICIGCRYLKEVTLPNLTSIGNSAFYYCESFEKFILPSSYTSIAANAFYHCDGMEHFVILNQSSVVSLANVNAFTNTSCNFYVPDNLVDSYKAATNWTTYADRILPLSDCPSDVYSTGSED